MKIVTKTITMIQLTAEDMVVYQTCDDTEEYLDQWERGLKAEQHGTREPIMVDRGEVADALDDMVTAFHVGDADEYHKASYLEISSRVTDLPKHATRAFEPLP